MTRLGEILRLYRLAHNQTIRASAAELGLAVPTLHRLEVGSGKSAGKADTLVKVMQWLIADVDEAAPDGAR